MLEDRSDLWEDYNKLPKFNESSAKSEKLLFNSMLRATSGHTSRKMRIPRKFPITSHEHRRASVNLDWIICTDGVNVPEAKVTLCGQKNEMKSLFCANGKDILPSCEKEQQIAIDSHNVTAPTSQEINRKPGLDWIIDTKPEHYIPYDEDERSSLQHFQNETEDVENENSNTALCLNSENAKTSVAETVHA